MQTIYLVITGFGAGILGSVLGLGGGIITVPALTLVFGSPITEAVGISLLGVTANSTTSAIDFLRSGRADLGLGLKLETTTVFGALTGGLLAGFVSPDVIHILFSVVLIYAALNMARPKSKNPENEMPVYPQHLSVGMWLSFLAGNVSGLLGVGGGVIKVPVMNMLMKVPLKIATATSSYMVGVTTASGAIIYMMRGDIDFHKAAPLIIGIFARSKLGASISYKINALAIRLLFVAVMLYTAYKLIARAL